MARAVADIERETRELSASDREQLLRSLIVQLDGPSDANVEQAWRTEAERRLKEVEQGIAKTVPGPQVIDEARALIKSLKQ